MSTRVAIVLERDPDGGTYVHLSVDGQWVEIGSASEEVDVAVSTIDAGAGHEGVTWFEGVADVVRDALPRDGREFATCLLDAYRNPPGRKYIDDFDEAREAFDAETPDLAFLRQD
jgi:hypothetical protein